MIENRSDYGILKEERKPYLKKGWLRMESKIPSEVRKAVEDTRKGEIILEQIWPPSERLAEVRKLQNELERHGERVERAEVVEFLKSMSKHGYGNYIVGRKGWDTRLEWNERIHDLPVEGNGSLPAQPTSQTIDHKFVLRPGFEVSLVLPEDLSSREAERLGDFIKTLPFDNKKG